ncbi:MAG TPA: hypothetical protein VGV85_07045, partial [Longimicrobiaceae bacterium]|nr:hypothetical protein [Longimicrobiaceae bacterium]
MADPGLVVPIRVEALLVGRRDAPDNHFLPPHADFGNLPYKGGGLQAPYLSSLALSQPFTGNAPLPQGIHLHWNLPRALRRGAYDDAGSLHLPEVPNRWLVTRVLVSTADPQDPAVSLTSWVVESDYVSATGDHSGTTIPQDPGGQTFAYLGRVYPLDEWLAGGGRGAYLSSLTAMGFGVADFSSYYPNCRNVFGLLDASLNDGYDPATTQLAYVVTGWYADPAKDPLHANPISGADNPFGWLFPGGATPAYSLYSGAVWAVGWNPAIAYFPDYATPIAPRVALGNTPMEALSALAARELRGVTQLKDVERVLNALQLGALKGLDRPDGLATLEEAEYDSAYASADGGTVWDVRPLQQGAVSAREARARPYAGVPPAVAHDLEQLNGLQRRIGRQQREAAGLQGQVFADWQKFLTVLYAQDPSAYPPVNDVYAFVSAEIAALDGITGAGGTLAGLMADAQALRESIAARLPGTLRLVSLAAPRFYAANDPVVLLSGDGVPGRPADDAPTVRCVTTDLLASAVSLPARLVQGSDAVTLHASALPSPDAGERLPYPAIGALVQLAELLNPDTARAVAAAVLAAGGANNPARLDFAGTRSAIRTAQTAFLGGTAPGDGIAFTGTPPQPTIALRQWAVPWNPLALSWRFRWYQPQALADAGGSYDAGFVLDNFTWDEDALGYALTRPRYSDTVQQYSGTVL